MYIVYKGHKLGHLIFKTR